MTVDDAATAIWEYVPLEAYRSPTDTVQRTVATRIANFWQKLRHPESGRQAPVGGADEMKPLTSKELHYIAPEPDWRDAAAALERHLTTSVGDPSSSPVTALVSPPYAGQSETLAILARQQGWRIAASPSLQQIMDARQDELDALNRGTSPWVIPQLEKWFLRHEKGLHLVRRLLADAVAGNMGQGVIGCSSWAWSFLHNVTASTTAIPAITPQALDADRLQDWISRMTYRQKEKQNLHFRLPGQTDELLFAREASPDDRDDPSNTGRFFIHMAAHCRGIAGVAWSVWRDGLRKPKETSAMSAKHLPDDRKESLPGNLYGALPWYKRQFPSVPSLERPAGPFVLHALMLHTGLPESVLRDLIPGANGELAGTLSQLRSSGVVALANGIWNVTALGYPAVRSYLRSENYLTDSH